MGRVRNWGSVCNEVDCDPGPWTPSSVPGIRRAQVQTAFRVPSNPLCTSVSNPENGHNPPPSQGP